MISVQRDPEKSRDPGIGSQSRSRDYWKYNPGIFRDFGIAQKTMFTKTFICFQTASGSFLYSQNLSKCFKFLLYRPWQILPFTRQSWRAKKDFSCSSRITGLDMNPVPSRNEIPRNAGHWQSVTKIRSELLRYYTTVKEEAANANINFFIWAADVNKYFNFMF